MRSLTQHELPFDGVLPTVTQDVQEDYGPLARLGGPCKIIQSGAIHSDRPSIAIFFHALTGAGHEARVSAITQSLSAGGRVNPIAIGFGRVFSENHSSGFVFGTDTTVLQLRNHYDTPSGDRGVYTNEGTSRPISEAPTWIAEQANQIRKVLSILQPSLVATEFFPFGYSEIPAFRHLLDLVEGVPLVSVVRDLVRATPESIESLGIANALEAHDKDWKALFRDYEEQVRRAVAMAKERYASVFVMGDGSLPVEAGFPPSSIEELRRYNRDHFVLCGYTAGPSVKMLSIPLSEREIVVTSGSGSLARGSRSLYEAAIDARLNGLLDDFPNPMRIVLGPAFPDEKCQEIERRAANTKYDIRISRSLTSRDLEEAIANARVAVIRGGLNTSLYCMRYRVPFVSIPAMDAEQLIRSFALQRSLAGQVPVLLKPDEGELAQAIVRACASADTIRWPARSNIFGAAVLAAELEDLAGADVDRASPFHSLLDTPDINSCASALPAWQHNDLSKALGGLFMPARREDQDFE